jgi:intein/homing endonuclease
MNGLGWRLRRLGLSRDDSKVNQGNGKHIPAIYQQASAEQRRSLLQGLMDTDGTCNTRGTATFTNKNERLADDVFELSTALGLKPTIRRYVVVSTLQNFVAR